MSVNDECFDIGTTTSQTLGFWKKQLRKTDYDNRQPGSTAAKDIINAIQTAVNVRYGTEPEVTVNGEIIYNQPKAGNGSLMRTILVTIIPKSDKKALTMERECSRTTHPAAICSDCCVDIVRMALTGASLQQMAATCIVRWKKSMTRSGTG
jgi:ADP-ribosylglycohydrolase